MSILAAEPKRIIRLYGILGATFGREFNLSVASPKEAIRALCVIVPGFERFLNTSKQRGLTYAVFSGKRNLLNDELNMDRSTEEIRIAPVIIGSKRAGVFQTILGLPLSLLLRSSREGLRSGLVVPLSLVDGELWRGLGHQWRSVA